MKPGGDVSLILGAGAGGGAIAGVDGVQSAQTLPKLDILLKPHRYLYVGVGYDLAASPMAISGPRTEYTVGNYRAKFGGDFEVGSNFWGLRPGAYVGLAHFSREQYVRDGMGVTQLDEAGTPKITALTANGVTYGASFGIYTWPKLLTGFGLDVNAGGGWTEQTGSYFEAGVAFSINLCFGGANCHPPIGGDSESK